MKRVKLASKIFGVLFAGLLAAALLCGLFIPRAQAAEEVVFADPNLEAAVREALRIPTGPITPEQMAGLTCLYASWRGIQNLSGLEYAVNLEELDLWGNQISDLGPLSNLTNLDHLILVDNQISDLRPLSNLTTLQWLSLRDNQISDLSPLSNLTNLEGLELAANKISNLGPLSNLTNLQYLDLGGNQINNLGPLSNLTNLFYLDLSHNQVSDIGLLVANSGLSTPGDYINISYNYLDLTPGSKAMTDIQTLINRGVRVEYEPQHEPQIDTTPPTWPEGSRLEVSDVTQTSLTLTWTAATDNVGVTAYRISCNGQQIAEVPGEMLSHQATDLVPGTQYTFKVEAGDAAGNWSTDGPGITVTTPPEAAAVLYLEPAATHLMVGEEAVVSLMVRNAQDLYGIDVQLHFDPAVVEVTPGGLTIGDIVAGLTVESHTYYDNDTGLIRVVTSRRGDQYQEGFTGTGELFRVTFRGRAPGVTSLSFGPVELSDSEGQGISCTTEASFIEVVPFVTVRGQVRLQGVRGYAGGVQLSLVDQTGREVASTTSSTDGNYEFSRTHDGNPIPPGTYRVIAVKTPGYLRAASPEFTVTGDIYEFELLPLELLAGDISGDNIVDIDDLLILRGAYDTIQGEENYHPAADLNANGRVDLFDLVLLARNYTKEGFAY